MKSHIIKNIVWIVVAVVLSNIEAVNFGLVYSKFVGGLGGAWIGARGAWESIIGLPFAYIFFVTFLLKVFGKGNKKKWILWALLPVVLFFAVGDLRHIYLPIILGSVAYLLGEIVQLIVVKFKMR